MNIYKTCYESEDKVQTETENTRSIDNFIKII
jgi:hypothetical protein